MRIVVDLQSNQSGSRHGGIGRYSLDLLKAMISENLHDEFIVLLNDQYNAGENYVRAELRNLISPNNIVTFSPPRGCATINGSVALTNAAEVLRENFIINLNPDVVHVTSLVESLHDDIVTSIGCLENGPPTAATLYDLIPIRQRKLYLSSPITKAHYFQKINHLRKADALLAISDYSAREMLEFFPDYKGILKNIDGGIAKNFKIEPNTENYAKIRNKYDLKKKFILYTASFDQRKNQRGLIEAFATLPCAIRSQHQLAFAGGGNSKIYEDLTAHGLKLGLAREDIRFLGRVPDEDLVSLYNSCDAFVFPPMWEGMGMPPLEAMACGAPVIGSNTTSIPEVIGWADATFDPFNTDSIAGKLKQVMHDSDFRAENIRRGAEHVKKFDWKFSAQKALNVLQSISKPQKSPQLSFSSSLDVIKKHVRTEELIDEKTSELAQCILKNDSYFSKHAQHKVGWVTSWNARCGIADYSETIIGNTKNNVVILASYKSNSSPRNEVLNVIRCWDEGKHDPLVELTSAIDRLALDAIHIQFNYGFYDFDALNTLIHHCVWKGIAVFMTMHSTVDQSEHKTYQLSYLSGALKLCSCIFVHSVGDVERLSKLGSNKNVRLIPLTNPSITVNNNPLQERSFELLSTYGFALPGKGLTEIVEALSIIRKGGRDVRLQMLNAAYDDKHGISNTVIQEVRKKIKELSLEEYIDIRTDFMENETSIDLLSKSDIIIFPYSKTGESGSAAIRQGLLTEQPVLVTPLDIFADVDAVVFKTAGTSPHNIATSAIKLLENIKNKDKEVIEKKINVRRLNNVCSSSEISRHINQTITLRTALNFWKSVFVGEPDIIPRASGTLRHGSIVAAVSGLLCYGPYIDLTSGIYRITLKGKLVSSKNEDAATLVITAQSGGVQLGTAQLFPLEDNIIGDYIFEVNSYVSGVEFVITINESTEIELFGYEVSKYSK